MNAVSVPEALRGFRLICNGFHHLSPEQARACLRDAVDKGQGIAVAEIVDRSPSSLVMVALGISAELAVTPFIRPRRAWVRVTEAAGDTDEGDEGDEPARGTRRTVVELAGLDRSSGGDLDTEIDELERRIRAGSRTTTPEEKP